VTAPQDPFEKPAATPPPPAPGYGPPPPGYGPPPPGSRPTGTNALAIVSLVAAFLCVPAGLVCGIIALSQIKKTGQDGRGLALAGTILSAVFLVLTIVAFAAIIALGTSTSNEFHRTCVTVPGGGTC
jgi:peptidyl-prolyl cis-trans isomerase B (cyclophilin B)